MQELLKAYKVLPLLIMFVMGCTEHDTEMCCPQNDETSYEFSILNRQGKDLLDASEEGTYNTNKIKLYRLKNGNRSLVEYTDGTSPVGYYIYKYEGINRIRLYFGNNDDLITEGIIEWSENESDMIKLEEELQNENDNVRKLVKITYNNVVVWDMSKNLPQRYFQVIK
ncbi:hypothetical protein [Flammeovirga sp. EKP202]|uniref:hypothetical protein n=1 Tax=Flammeovirga sp. EKP202 TaxID=2770592 RepID=UPI00165F5862|nr:hypothetical protein [Flammeovirga sp. EKP202]MBD0404859.1 hypothetical protein [Flammeovirga sp. EKP202]